MLAKFPDLEPLLAALEQPHKDLHATAQPIQELKNAGGDEEARAYYKDKTLPALAEIQAGFLALSERVQEDVANLESAFAAQTSFSYTLTLVLGIAACGAWCTLAAWPPPTLKTP